AHRRARHEPRRRRALAPAAVRGNPPRGGQRSMKIGLTYDLRQEYLAAGYSEEETAEFDRPDTIDAIETALRQLGYDTDRIGHARIRCSPSRSPRERARASGRCRSCTKRPACAVPARNC